jgi:galactose-1-phosphate uridylyltransferase
MRPPWLETCRFGARLQHPHSQIIAIRLIPARCVNRPYEALRLLADAGERIFCHLVEREVEDQTRTVLKSEIFVAI